MSVATSRSALPRSNRRSLLVSVAPIVAAVALPLAMLAFSRVEFVDDAFITYRYAHNVALGRGLVFNAGERVEGVTNLLWTLLMAMFERMGVPAYRVGGVIGLGFAVMAMFEVWRICRIVGVQSWAAKWASIALGVYAGYWQTAANGLEGGLFAFLLMRTLGAILSEAAPAVLGIWGGLLFMTRPESVLVIGLAFVYSLVNKEPGWMSWAAARRAALVIAPWAAFVAAVTIWRWLYFGAWIPNTIVAKSLPRFDAALIASNVRWGALYYRDFIASSLVIAAGVGLSVLLAPRRAWVWLFLGLFAIQIPIVLLNGGDWMPNSRLLAVYAPAMTVLLALSIERIGAMFRTGGSAGQLMIAGATAVVVALSIDVTLHVNTWTKTAGLEIYEVPSCWEALAQRLRPALGPADSLALDVLGYFGYVNPDVSVHDLFGLADVYTARHGELYERTYGKYSPEHTYQVRPTVLVPVYERFFMPPLVRVSGNRFDAEYTTFDVTVASLACERRTGTFMLSVRNDAAGRVMRAFDGLELRPRKAADITPAPPLGRPPFWRPITVTPRTQRS